MDDTLPTTVVKPKIPPKPEVLSIKWDKIPLELVALAQWIVSLLEWNGTKWDKPPYNARYLYVKQEDLARSNARSTWVTYDSVRKAFQGKSGWTLLGFVLSDRDNIGVIDIDGCIDQDGKIHPDALKIVKFFNSYTEISPSGRGLRIFILDEIGLHKVCTWKKDVPWSAWNDKTEVEIWSKGKYATVTGHFFENYTKIMERPGALLECYNAHPFAGKPKTVAPSNNGDGHKWKRTRRMDKDEILGLIQKSKMADVFFDLHDRGVGTTDDESALDWQYFSILRFWTQDAEQLRGIHADSQLYREKTDERRNGSTYVEETIQKALAKITKTYRGPRAKKREETRLDAWMIPSKAIKAPKGAGAKLNDAGNASRFVAQWIGQVFWCVQLGKWFWWDKTRWKEDENNAKVEWYGAQTIERIETEAMALAQAEGKSAGMQVLTHALKSGDGLHLETMLKRARRFKGMSYNLNELDQNQWLINLPNGTLDLRLKSFGLRPHDPKDLITMLAPVIWNPDAKQTGLYKLWIWFVNHFTSGDKKYAAFLQRAEGYCLTGDMSEDVHFLFKGASRSGKSTYMTGAKNYFGDYAVSTRPELWMKKSGDQNSQPELRVLEHKRLVISVEIDPNRQFASGSFNQLSAGDTITARAPWEVKPYTFAPECKAMFASNNDPKIAASERGLFNRLLKCPCDHVPNKEIPKLRQWILHNPKLWEARLQWAVEGCLDWQRLTTRKLDPPEIVKEASKTFREDASPVSEFVEIFLKPELGGMIPVSDLWQVYNKWAGENNHENTFNTKSALMSAIRDQEGFGEIHNNENKTARVAGINAHRKSKCDGPPKEEPARVRVGLKWSDDGWDWITERLQSFDGGK